MKDAPARDGPELFIGLMSGTSADGVDGVLARFGDTLPQVLHSTHRPFDAPLRQRLIALNQPGDDEWQRGAEAAAGLVSHYVDAVQDLLQAARLQPGDITAVGAHGQTVRHHPPVPGRATAYTVQINHPALLAERTGIDVVADFRARDLAAGGQGAPLVPAFHHAIFGQPGRRVAVINLGGIANISLLDGDGGVTGWDTGPANCLMDAWCERHTGHAMDRDGAWAATGQVHQSALTGLLADPYFHLAAPKSTGRDHFHLAWLEAQLTQWPGLAPQDVQATLLALTVQSVCTAVRAAAPQRVVLCGGGAYNQRLYDALRQALPSAEVLISDALGWPAQEVEASAFAWLAWRTMHRRPGNEPAVTGASGYRVLGAVYPA